MNNWWKEERGAAGEASPASKCSNIGRLVKQNMCLFQTADELSEQVFGCCEWAGSHGWTPTLEHLFPLLSDKGTQLYSLFIIARNLMWKQVFTSLVWGLIRVGSIWEKLILIELIAVNFKEKIRFKTSKIFNFVIRYYTLFYKKRMNNSPPKNCFWTLPFCNSRYH